MTTEVFRGIRRQLRKKVPVTPGPGVSGFTTVPNGYEIADVEVSVNLADIARQLGERSMGNKSGISKYMNGAIVVRALNRTREP